MKYYKRLKVYKRANLTFDPATGEGWSYRWYSITRKIGKTQVLNTFNYSKTTSSHVWMVASVLIDLSISYIAIEAPQGLQDLDRAMKHHALEREKAAIRLKTARKPERYTHLIEYHDDAIKFLKKQGIKHDAKAAKAAAIAEIELHKKEKQERLLYKAQLVAA